MAMDPMVTALPKAELHVHIEGTVTPAMAKELAERNGVDFPEDVLSADGKSFVWNDFLDCVTRVYNAAAMTVQTQQDYEDVVYDYLLRSADEGCIYTELIAYPSHLRGLQEKFPEKNIISYEEMIDGIAAGIDKARDDAGIEARINVALVRHDKAEWNDKAVEEIIRYPHPYVVGLDLAGGEAEGDIAKFKALFDEIKMRSGKKLGVRIHAGEAAGPANVDDAINILGVSRIGHGVRSVEDMATVKHLVGKMVTLEICPTSNILLVKQTPDFKSHPLKKLADMGVRVTLNSDDPGLFGNSIGTEYQIAKKEFGFTDRQLVQITQMAIESSFVDVRTKMNLMQKVKDWDFFLWRNRPKPGGNPPRPL